MPKKRSSKPKSRGTFANVLNVIKKVVIYFFAITILWVLAYRFINPPTTWLMVQRGLERKAAGKEWKIIKIWKNNDELSKNIKLAAMAGEDAAFLNHWGFDLKAIQRAYQKNQHSQTVTGGSTISQQTAKNVFLWPGRSWIRKGFEAYFTVLIELIWGKNRILEVYLNVIETGDGLYGAEAASKTYFGTSTANISKAQAALLVAVLPNPRRWSPAKPTSYIYNKQSLILRNMRRLRNVKF